MNPQLLKIIGRNIAGVVLILIGLILRLTSIVTGGFLMTPGIILLQFPGKRKLLERREKNRFISQILDKQESIRKIWKSLYTQAGPIIGKKKSDGI
ncbi:hypothetical protein HY229_07380 [Candidatus Acetothermia bacterium]|nr:hypothetical protein [Candidatus Acetothermia bacterium]MBI3643901.1 hypothetical protein [Candidatus Acetothermia bacterium]